MSARIRTILILGASGGLGEQIARRFHALGKKVIVTAREQDRNELTQLARELHSLEFRIWDLTHLDKLQAEVQSILDDFPALNSVYINATIQNHYEIFDQGQDDGEVVREMTTNLTSPILVASSLAYFPVPFYPVYCSSKAGIAAFTKGLRMQLELTGCKNMNVVEVVPPYVDTPLNSAHRDITDALQGGKGMAVQPMPLEEYIGKFFTALEDVKPNGSLKDKIGVGFGAQGAAVWHQGFQKLLNMSGMTV